VEDLTKLSTDFGEWREKNNPSDSTWKGHCQFNDRMESFNLTDIKNRKRVRHIVHFCITKVLFKFKSGVLWKIRNTHT